MATKRIKDDKKTKTQEAFNDAMRERRGAALAARPKSERPWLFQVGNKGGPGRPKGTTSLKEFARDYLVSLPDEEKARFMAYLPYDLIWRMAEGNPHNTEDVRHTVAPTPIARLDILAVSGVDTTAHVLPSVDGDTPMLLDASPIADGDTP